MCLGEYRGPRQAHAFVWYLLERFRRERVDRAYRAYVTDQLRGLGAGEYMTTRWVDLVDSMSVPKTPERTAEEIVEDVIAAAGLEVVNGWEPA